MRSIIIENVDLMSADEEKVLKQKLKEAKVMYKEVDHDGVKQR